MPSRKPTRGLYPSSRRARELSKARLLVKKSTRRRKIGGGGLGNFAIMYGYQQFNWEVTLVTVLIIIVMVQAAQLLGNFLAQRILRR